MDTTSQDMSQETSQKKADKLARKAQRQAEKDAKIERQVMSPWFDITCLVGCCLCFGIVIVGLILDMFGIVHVTLSGHSFHDVMLQTVISDLMQG